MTASRERDPVTLAIEAFEKVYKVTGDNAGGLKSRLRALPSLVQEAGLVTAILFYSSKNKIFNEKIPKAQGEERRGPSRIKECFEEERDLITGKTLKINEFNLIINYLLYSNDKNRTINIEISNGEKRNKYAKGKLTCLINYIFNSKKDAVEGYGTALALTVYGLIKLCPQTHEILKNACSTREDNSENNIELRIDCLISLLKTLRSNEPHRCDEIKAMAVLEDYFLTLKRLAEATISGD